MFPTGRARSRRVARRRILLTAIAGLALVAQFAAVTQIVDPQHASAHSVGLRNTRVFFSPDTSRMLIDRALSSGTGLQAGDVIDYIVEFEPFENGAVAGPGGYVTFYPPSWTEVVGAAIVDLQGNDFVEIPVAEPGPFYDGVGPLGSQTPFGAPFAGAVDGSLAQLYGDTGIFFSTDTRTAKYVGGADPDVVPLGNNGYPVNPTACGQLIPADWDNCWAHNQWDRFMADSMGTKDGSIIASGRGNTPYLAGSPVAGPDSYYDLDYSGSVGPWQRIQYPGSQIGTGPAPSTAGDGLVAPTAATAWVPVTPGVNDGRALDESNPLPSGTTAVRFAVGGLVADETSANDLMWAKVSLRVVDVPTSCYPIDSEVFGGDAGSNDGGKDNMWRYYVPIAATNSACLVIDKDGPSVVEEGSTITYTVSVANTSPTTLTNVVVADAYDPATSFVSASDGGTASGGTVTWPTITSMGPGEVVRYTVTVTAPASAGMVENNVAAFSDQTSPVNAVWQTEVVPPAPPSLTIAKSASPTAIAEPGGAVTFSILIESTSIEPITVTSLTDDVFGDLLDPANPLVTDNSCTGASLTLDAGGSLSCSFVGTVTGFFGDPAHLDTITVVAEDGDGMSTSEYDSASVAFTDAVPTITVTKTPSVASVSEPGAPVTFTLALTNESGEAVTLVSLTDDVFGDLLDAGNPLITSDTCADLPASWASGATFGCSFDALVIGAAADPDHVNTVTFTVEDDELNRVSAEASATVAFDDVAPTATVTKTPSSGTVTEPGGSITFTVRITNTGVEDLTIDGLGDDVFGDLLDAGNGAVMSNGCDALAASIAPDETVECSFTADLVGLYGDPDHVDVVTATLSDDDGNTITPFDDAVVAFAPANSTVSGVVFQDLDLDGVRDPGEDGLAGIDLVVTGSGGGPTTVTTAGDGTWSVAVLPGATTVDLDETTLPAGWVHTTANNSQTITAVVDTDVTTAPMGYGPQPGSISGLVFMDLDGDPDHDTYEPVFAGVTVTLLDSGGSVVASMDTGTDGRYDFDGLPVGDYTVVIDSADVGTGFAGTVDPDAVVDDETDVIVTMAAVVTDVDFGYAGTGSIGDTVWIDEDENGEVDEFEEPLPGAVISVVWAGPDGQMGTADDYDFGSRVSDGDGWYSFDGLPAGVYRITVSVDDGAIVVIPTTPADVTTTLGTGQVWVMADFGFTTEGELPFTGLDAEHLMLAAALMLGLAGLVLADGRARERRFDIALDRIRE